MRWAEPQKSKYGAKKIIVDGITWDSKGEYARWCQLRQLEKAGAITDLQRQVSFELAPSVVIQGRKKPALKFTLDFTYRENGQLVAEDFKSPATAEETSFRIRLHLLKHIHNIDVRLTVKGRKK